VTTDGWILVSLFFAGPVKRSDVAGWKLAIGAADWINHAVVTYEELSSSVRSLARHGLLVERAGGVVALAPAAKKGLAAAYGTRKRMSVFKLWEAADALIARQKPRPSTLKGPTPSVYRRAVESYVEQMSRS
jgi:hypothetical protein